MLSKIKINYVKLLFDIYFIYLISIVIFPLILISYITFKLLNHQYLYLWIIIAIVFLLLLKEIDDYLLKY